MRCIYCGEEMKRIKTSIKAYWGNYELEIKGVEPYKCSKCEHEVYTAEEAKMIQDITKGYADFSATEKPKVLNVEEVADLLRVTNQTVYNMIKDGRLPAFKAGREWRVSRKELEKIKEPLNISIAARGENLSENDISIIKSLI